MHALLLALACSLTQAVSPAPRALWDLDEASFIAVARRDLATLERYIDGMDRLVARAQGNPSIFTPSRAATYTLDEKRAARSLWAGLFAYFSSAEQLRHRYLGFLKLSPGDGRHAWGFLLAHAALTAELDYGLAFAALAQGNQQLETLFDEADAELGLPARAFAGFKIVAIHVGTTSQLLSGAAWMPIAEKALAAAGVLEEGPVAAAWRRMRTDSDRALERLGKKGAALFAGNALDVLRDSSAALVFPAQKSFAEWAGDTRVARGGRPLISAAQRNRLARRMVPGDIVVTRQNWFLSNIALPGFWPHAELYIGTPAELSAYFDGEPDIRRWAASQPEHAETFTKLLEARFPQKWAVYTAGVDFQGHGPIRVIESVSEGVSFTALEHALGVDYAGVMRPRLRKLDVAKAILRAFAFQGRPYDFEFDFDSDATLVCTELVYKAYQPASDQAGLRIELVHVAGRRTLPANELVKLFDREADHDDRQLDFVAFLDGREKQGDAVEADEAAFRRSHARPKWDVVQK